MPNAQTDAQSSRQNGGGRPAQCLVRTELRADQETFHHLGASDAAAASEDDVRHGGDCFASHASRSALWASARALQWR